MGRSASARRAARTVSSDHARYLDAWFEALGLTCDVTLVVHDWGSALGFHRALALPRRTSRRSPTWRRSCRRDDGRISADARPDVSRVALGDEGERLVMEREFLRRDRAAAGHDRGARRGGDGRLSARRSASASERLPMLAWPRELPIEGEPADVIAIVEATARWLARQRHAEAVDHTAIRARCCVGRAREFCRSWPNSARSRSGPAFPPKIAARGRRRARQLRGGDARLTPANPAERIDTMKLSFATHRHPRRRQARGVLSRRHRHLAGRQRRLCRVRDAHQRPRDREPARPGAPRGMNVTAPAANRSVILDFEVADVDRERARLASWSARSCWSRPTSRGATARCCFAIRTAT